MAAASREIRIAAAQYPLEKLTTLSAYADKQTRWVRDAVAKTNAENPALRMDAT